MKLWRLTAALAMILAAVPCLPAPAGVRLGIGIGLPFPGCYYPAPYYAPYYYGYYPQPIVVAPAPVVVAPTMVASPPTVVQPGYPPAQTAPPPPAPLPEQIKGMPRTVAPTVALDPVPDQAAVDRSLQQLNQGDERARIDACITLGRLRAQQAVEALKKTLAGDRSSQVREAAARGLGLIGSPSALPALQTAAQADDDRDVRTSARFAADVIHSHR